MPFAKAAWIDGHESFIYAGKNERWRDALNEGDVALYRTRAEHELSPTLNRWLTHGRRSAGDPEIAPE